jgi:hypothetical protein
MGMHWNVIRILLAAAVCVAVVWVTHRPPDTRVPEVYDPFCRGVMAADPAEKIRWLDAALRIDPGLAAAHKERGTAYVEKGQFDRAIQEYGRAIELNPGYAEAYSTRAGVWCRKQEYDKAWADLRTWRRLGGRVEPPFVESLRQTSGQHE